MIFYGKVGTLTGWFLACLMFVVPTAQSWGQSKQLTHVRRFTNIDGLFSFKYPSALKLCSAVAMPDCRTEAMLSACQVDAIVCVTFRRGTFGNTLFDGAGFQVREVVDLNSSDTCVTPKVTKGGAHTAYLISAAHPEEQLAGFALFTA